MNEKTLIIAILIALILLWGAEILNMKKTRALLTGAVNVGIAMLK